jgi:hypothetical protein
VRSCYSATMKTAIPKPISIVLIHANLNVLALVETLRSLERQDYQNVRVVVVLEPSSDGAAEHVRDFKTKSSLPIALLLNQAVIGESSSLNRGLAWITSEMAAQSKNNANILFSSVADAQILQGSLTIFRPGDLILSDCLVHTAALLREHSAVHFIYGGGIVECGEHAMSPEIGVPSGWTVRLPWLAALHSTTLFDNDASGSYVATQVRLAGAGASMQRREPVFKAGHHG